MSFYRQMDDGSFGKSVPLARHESTQSQITVHDGSASASAFSQQPIQQSGYILQQASAPQTAQYSGQYSGFVGQQVPISQLAQNSIQYFGYVGQQAAIVQTAQYSAQTLDLHGNRPLLLSQLKNLFNTQVM